MAYLPDLNTLTLYRSMAVDEFTSMNDQLRLQGAKKNASPDDRVSLANLRAALRLLNRLGAVDPTWLKRLADRDDR